MENQDFTTTIAVDQTPKEAFAAINNVRGWWGKDVEGSSGKLGDEFVFQVKDVHYSKQKLVEVIPDKKIVWLVTDSKLNFLKDKGEWTGTKIIFDISPKGDKTHIRFTHEGLVPAIECFGDCSSAWRDLMTKSLYGLITTGEEQPMF